MSIRGRHILASPLIILYSSLLATSAAAQTCPCDSCDATQKYNCGEWSAIASSNWPGTAPNKEVIPVHMVLTKTGKLLMWKGTVETNDGAHYWDPFTFESTALPITTPAESTLFCAGHNVLGDGRVVVIGGQCNNCGLASERPIGIRRTMVFDPDAGSPAFTQRRDMARGRWYPTATILPDGKLLGISGWKKGNKPGEGPDPPVLADTSEVYSIYSGSWTNLSSAPKNDISIYPFIQVDPSPNGTRVLYLGPGANAHDDVPPYGTLQPAQRLKNLDAGTPTWEPDVGTYAVRGAAFARYNKDKVLKSGGIPSGGGSVTNEADVLTINMSTGNITAALTDDMCAARSEHQLVVLADGTVLALAGASVERGGGDLCAEGIYVTELWDPGTACWRQLAEMRPRSPKVPRMYHSTAVLLADASVLLAGGECKLECPGNPAGDISCRSGDFFKPPYLFKSDNSLIGDADRPAITGNVPLSIVYGEGLSFDRTTGNDATGISKVALVKPGSTTHSVNMAQQYIPLTFTDGSTLTVSAANMPNTRLAPRVLHALPHEQRLFESPVEGIVCGALGGRSVDGIALDRVARGWNMDRDGDMEHDSEGRPGRRTRVDAHERPVPGYGDGDANGPERALALPVAHADVRGQRAVELRGQEQTAQVHDRHRALP